MTPKMKTKFASSTGRDFRLPRQDGSINFSLRAPGYKVALLLAIGIPAAVLAIKATHIAMAARLASRLNTGDLRRAIALDPGNAAYDNKLGLVCSYSLDRGNLCDAVKFLRKATKLNPRKALYWSDLAEACDMSNDPVCSNPAVEKALSLSPMTPLFEWRAGNHYLQMGHTSDALAHFRRLLALDGAYAQPVFRITLSALGDPEKVYQNLLPAGASPQLKLAYLDFVSTHRDLAFANQLWKQIASDRLSCKFSDVKVYLADLLGAGDVSQATRVWGDLEKAGVVSKPAVKKNVNLVYNGGFEHAPLNAGFGWHDQKTRYVETDFRDPSAYQGSRCLRVDYAAGQNLASEPVYELVPVEPCQSYHLRGYVSSDGISSHSGPRLRVLDVECPACLNVSTATTVGTTPWHLVTLNFTTGPRTRVIRLSVWRPRSRTFPMEISGSFWLDDVSIEARNSMPKGTASTR